MAAAAVVLAFIAGLLTGRRVWRRRAPELPPSYVERLELIQLGESWGIPHVPGEYDTTYRDRVIRERDRRVAAEKKLRPVDV